MGSLSGFLKNAKNLFFLKIAFIIFSKYKSNTSYCGIFETFIKITKRKMKFTPHPTTYIELNSSEANLCNSLQRTYKVLPAARWPEAHLELNGTKFL